MTYKTDPAYDRGAQNESRADLAECALAVATDRNGEGNVADIYLDVSDLIANLMHFCDRAGLDWAETLAHGEHGYQGDAEDGAPTQRDAVRFPEVDA